MSSKRNFVSFLALTVLLLASLACGTSTTVSPQPTNSNQEQVQVEPSKVPEATKTPAPPPTPTPAPIGLSRSNPFLRTDLVSAPNWDVQVVEVKRGESAWQDIQAANMFN